MHPFPIKYECRDCYNNIDLWQYESSNGYCESCEPQPVHTGETCPECQGPYNWLEDNLRHISQESYKDYRKASVAYFYLTSHWLVKLGIKLKLLKL